MTTDSKQVRLHKFLAHAGFGSRRACEELILAGRVRVDGEIVTQLGTTVDPEAQQIRVDEEIVRPERKVYFVAYKPRGYVCTNAEDESRPRVIDLFRGVAQRIYTVGRLDADSEGLILVTNDGEFANRVGHPRYGVPKVYHVRVRGYVDREKLQKLRQGVWLSCGKVRPTSVRILHRERTSTVLEVRLQEGKNREVRRMFARLGFVVRRLIRVAIGPIRDVRLAPGQYRRLSMEEIKMLMQTTSERNQRKYRRESSVRSKEKKNHKNSKR